jgi:apolipoprotein N-acyltransferase
MAQASRHVRKAIAVGFNYYRKLTFYTKYGDVFAWLCVLVTLTLCLLAAFSPLCAPAKEQRS